jgi:hypothetical protein
MKMPRQGKKFLFRRVLVALALALTVAAPASVLRSAGGNSCGWQTGCRELPMVCLDKDTGKEVKCPPVVVQNVEEGEGENVNGGWQTGLANVD